MRSKLSWLSLVFGLLSVLVRSARFQPLIPLLKPFLSLLWIPIRWQLSRPL
ncbi:Uncharacterised protein [Vibrio cholerae]|nr:Uncharacterised protein [Vibrio cholerae]